MLSLKTAGVSFTCSAILLAGCGRDEVVSEATDTDGSRVLADQSPVYGDSIDQPTISVRIGPSAEGAPKVAVDTSASVEVPVVPTLQPVESKPEPDSLLLEWRHEAGVMSDLLGETLIYQDSDTGAVFRGTFDVTGLRLVELLDDEDGFVPLPDEGRFVLGTKLSKTPMSFWAEERSALVEVQGCKIYVDSGLFECTVVGDTPVAIYAMSVVRDFTQVPEALWCLEGCPNPDGNPEQPFFDSGDRLQSLEDQVIEYWVDAGSGVLQHGDRAVMPEEGVSLVTGALFAPTKDNTEALACDLDEDGGEFEVCPWQPISVFYTYSVDADHILPVRTSLLYGAN